MTGHLALLDMRRQGHRPIGVWITDGETICASDWTREPNPFLGDFCPAVRLDASDIPETLDFRFVVGLTVHVACCRGDSRGRRLHQCLVDAKARVVATVLSNEVLLHG